MMGPPFGGEHSRLTVVVIEDVVVRLADLAVLPVLVRLLLLLLLLVVMGIGAVQTRPVRATALTDVTEHTVRAVMRAAGRLRAGRVKVAVPTTWAGVLVGAVGGVAGVRGARRRRRRPGLSRGRHVGLGQGEVGHEGVLRGRCRRELGVQRGARLLLVDLGLLAEEGGDDGLLVFVCGLLGTLLLLLMVAVVQVRFRGVDCAENRLRQEAD